MKQRKNAAQCAEDVVGVENRYSVMYILSFGGQISFVIAFVVATFWPIGQSIEIPRGYVRRQFIAIKEIMLAVFTAASLSTENRSRVLPRVEAAAVDHDLVAVLRNGKFAGLGADHLYQRDVARCAASSIHCGGRPPRVRVICSA